MKNALPFVFVVIAAAACSKSKTQKCEEARDKQLPKMEELVKRGVAEAAPGQAAETKAQGDKEVKLFREHFVDLCKKTDDFPFACTDLDPDKQTADCKTKLAPFWKDLYGSLPE